jgi:hypothetical protein
MLLNTDAIAERNGYLKSDATWYGGQAEQCFFNDGPISVLPLNFRTTLSFLITDRTLHQHTTKTAKKKSNEERRRKRITMKTMEEHGRSFALRLMRKCSWRLIGMRTRVYVLLYNWVVG